jgi:hypothetical protein
VIALSSSTCGRPSEKELRTVLDRELAALPEKLRAPLILCYLEGRSQEEAALRTRRRPCKKPGKLSTFSGARQLLCESIRGEGKPTWRLHG